VRDSSSVNSSICILDKLKKAFSELEIIAEQIISATTTAMLINMVATSVVVSVVLIILNTVLTGGSEDKLLSKLN
jgi:preprotein translocase subunit SecF